jgi:hypothetical protein
VPLINARREYKQQTMDGQATSRKTKFPHPYVDTLLDIMLPDEEGPPRSP